MNRGLFEPTVMFFGLTNSPATFQAMMNNIFSDMIDEGHVVVYMDDILIFTDNIEEHDKLIRRVLQRLKDNDLFLKPEKCTFRASKIEYLGLITSEGKLEMDQGKISAFTCWPTPKKVKEVQAFLGFGNFY